MKKLTFLTLFAVVYTVLWAQPATQRADSLLQKALPSNEHGLSVLVAREGKLIYEKVMGYADVENGKKVTANTTFRIGSVTKQFTASAILKLMEIGKLNLDDPLSKFIENFPKGDEVTIHHLLTHTSGIKSYTDEPGFIERVGKPVSEQRLIKEIKKLGYDYEPGAKWKYNNSAYFILGYLVEQISGVTYEAFLKENFFDPAGMSHTGVYYNDQKYTDEALGYTAEGEEIKAAINWEMSWAGGAGNLYSTAEDLLKWNNHLFAGELLKRESVQKAHTPVELNDGSQYPYGYGWSIGEHKGLKTINHGGGLHGFLSHLGYYPELKASIVVLSNASPPLYVVPGTISHELAEVFFAEYMKEEEADTTIYAGSYEYAGGAIMTISKKDDKFYGQLAGQPRYEIFPKEGSPHTFYWKVVEAEITFHIAGNGKVDYATHKQNGSERQVPRVEPRKVVEMSPGVFARYEGEYSLNGAWVKVWENGGAYYTQIKGQPKFQIYPMSDNRFFMKKMAVEIEFDKSEKRSTTLTIFQGGREIKATRGE